MPEMKGITAKIPAELHAEMKAYITAHQMTIEQFIKIAIENELHPKLVQEGKSLKHCNSSTIPKRAHKDRPPCGSRKKYSNTAYSGALGVTR